MRCTIYRDYIGKSQRSSLSPTGGVKSIPVTTENWLRKLYTYSKKNFNIWISSLAEDDDMKALGAVNV